MQSTTALDIVQCTGEQVRLDLRLQNTVFYWDYDDRFKPSTRLHVFLYPDHVCAVWVMLASTHRAVPPTATPR